MTWSFSGLKKPWMPACPWNNCTCPGHKAKPSFLLLFTSWQTSYLDPSGKWEWKLPCPEGKAVCPGWLGDTLFKHWILLSSVFILLIDCFMGHYKPQWQITQSQTISWPEQEEFNEHFGEKNSWWRNLKISFRVVENCYFHVEDYILLEMIMWKIIHLNWRERYQDVIDH